MNNRDRLGRIKADKQRGVRRKEEKMSKEEKGSRGAKNVYWGVLLLLGAAALVVGKLGYLEGIGVWSIIFSVCLVGFLIDGLVNRSFGEILFSLAFLIIVNDELLNLEAVTPWPVLGAAFLGTIGLNLLFPRFKKKGRFVKVTMGGKDYDGTEPVSEEKWNGDSVSYENAFGGSVKYPSGEISHIDAANAFGSLQIYFTDAIPRGGSVTVDVETAFGSMVLYVPSSWRVVLSTENAFGSTREHGSCNPAGDVVLFIRGEVTFGSLQIKYI